MIKEASRVDDFYALSAFEGWVGSTVWIVNPETTEPILIWAQKKIDGYKMFFVKFLHEFSRTFLIFRCTLIVLEKSSHLITVLRTPAVSVIGSPFRDDFTYSNCSQVEK